jgi:hypothetical protein
MYKQNHGKHKKCSPSSRHSAAEAVWAVQGGVEGGTAATRGLFVACTLDCHPLLDETSGSGRRGTTPSLDGPLWAIDYGYRHRGCRRCPQSSITVVQNNIPLQPELPSSPSPKPGASRSTTTATDALRGRRCRSCGT